MFQEANTRTFVGVAIAALIVVQSLFGCRKDAQENLSISQHEIPQCLLDLGYRPSDVELSNGDFLVEGDMVFSQANIESRNSKQYVYRINQLVSYANQNQIRVWPDGLNANWTTGLNQAMAEWNSLTNCRINFVPGTSANRHIRVYFPVPFPNGGTSCASADYPSVNTGIPGTFIQIRSTYLNTLSIDKIKLLFMHELGHTIGFDHSYNNPLSSVLIPGTAESDLNSIMEGTNCNTPYAQQPLTYFDRLAAALIYPDAPPLANTLPFYRYRNTTSTNHFYTLNWAEQGGNISPGNANGYIYEQIACYLPTAPFPGTIPLLRYRHSTNGTHFYSTTTIGSPYVYEGQQGYVFTSQVTGTYPLLRYRQSGTTHYLYTLFVLNLPDWSYEGITGYVFLPPVF